MATLAETAKILTGAMPLFPNFKLTVTEAAFTAAWHRHVGHLGAAQLQAAVDRAVAGSEFFPSVHEVLAAAGQLAIGAPKSGLEAWAELQQAIKDKGYYCPPDGGTPSGTDNWQVREVWHFSDPLITRLLPALGGWCALCTSDNAMSDRSQFVRAYELMAASERYHATEVHPQIAAPAIQIESELSVDEVQERLRLEIERRHKMAQLTAGIGKS